MEAMTIVRKSIRQNFVVRFYKHFIIDSIIIIKKFGFKALIRRRGIKFFVAIITYYLVRDTLVYIVIPLCIAKGLFE